MSARCFDCFHEERHHQADGCIRGGFWAWEHDSDCNVASMGWVRCRCPAFKRSPRDITLEDHLAYVDALAARGVTEEP